MRINDFNNGVPKDEEGFEYRDEDLESTDEGIRATTVVCISRLRLRQFENRFLEMLKCEQSELVRRHLVRALGNLGSVQAIPILVEILRNQGGLIVGDTIKALGQVSALEASALIEPLVNSPLEWVANNARWFLKKLKKEREKS